MLETEITETTGTGEETGATALGREAAAGSIAAEGAEGTERSHDVVEAMEDTGGGGGTTRGAPALVLTHEVVLQELAPPTTPACPEARRPGPRGAADELPSPPPLCTSIWSSFTQVGSFQGSLFLWRTKDIPLGMVCGSP